MDANTIQQQEQALRAEVARARARMQELAGGLRAVDAELERLAPRRQQYELLDQACGSLERLGQLGVAGLFWGERPALGDVDAHLREVRKRVGAFQAGLRELDGRRQAALDAIAAQEAVLEGLGEDLYQVEQQEERRKLEWVVERDISDVPRRVQALAWARGGDDDRRFRRSLAAALAASLLLGALLPMIDLPLPKPFRLDAVPPRLVQLVREEQAKPTPPPRVLEEPKPTEPKPQKPEPDPAQPVEPEQQLAQERPDTRKRTSDEPSPSPVRPEPQKTPEKAGILAFRDKFASLADDKVTPRLGRDARFTEVGDAAGEPTTRSMLTSNAPGSSGGINLAALSRNAGRGGGTGAGGGGGGAGGLHGVQVGRMTSSIGGGGGGGDGTGAGGDRPRAGSGAGLSRTDEEIQIVFDRYKAALYRLYNRELRKDPTLRGQMVLRLTIEPDGTVSMCALQASDMNAPDLSVQVVDRVRTINFGPKDGVQALTIVYPIDFLPAA